jgi:hypothetical protein
MAQRRTTVRYYQVMAQNPDTHKSTPYKRFPLGPDSVSKPGLPDQRGGPKTERRQSAGGSDQATTPRKAQRRQSAGGSESARR